MQSWHTVRNPLQISGSLPTAVFQATQLQQPDPAPMGCNSMSRNAIWSCLGGLELYWDTGHRGWASAASAQTPNVILGDAVQPPAPTPGLPKVLHCSYVMAFEFHSEGRMQHWRFKDHWILHQGAWRHINSSLLFWSRCALWKWTLLESLLTTLSLASWHRHKALEGDSCSTKGPWKMLCGSTSSKVLLLMDI